MPRAVLGVALALALAATLAGPAGAQTVKVQSGEHAGFSRLVLVVPRGTAWDLRRDEGGYRLRFPDRAMRFDLSDVFRLIPRDRLAAIRAEDGGLVLGLACACHAIAAEDRPGVLVIDLHDGPPPPGLASERAEDGRPMPPLTGLPPVPRPRSRPEPQPGTDAAARPAPPARYDWRDHAAGPALPRDASSQPPVLDRLVAAPAPDTQAVRRQIIEDMARGAARGVIEITMPEPDPAGATAGSETNEASPSTAASQVRIGGGIQVSALEEPRGTEGLSDTGVACIPDAELAIQDWGDEAPPSQALGRRTMAVLGEFDRPDPEAAATAVRYLLHLGFGAEAEAMLALAEGSVPAEPFRSMARILDGGIDPLGAFAGMEACPTAAALWAVLQLPGLEGHPQTDAGAVLRAFSALPVHLRRHLGPPLADRFLARGDGTTARALRDAILRAPGEAGDAVRLMEAEIERSAGRAPDPQALADLRAAPGETGVRATIAHLRAEAEAGRMPAASVVVAAEALIPTVGDTPLGRELREAIAPALAATGQAERALAMAGDGPAGGAVWAAIATHADPGTFLALAVRAPDLPPPALPAAARHAVAERLLGLGFPAAARGWLRPGALPPGEDPTAEALMVARADLAGGDARAALAALADRPGERADRLRAEALARLGDPAAAGALRAAGEVDRAAATDKRRRDWARLAGEGDPWGAAARAALAAPAGDEGLPPLAAGAALLEESGQARQALANLLAATPRP